MQQRYASAGRLAMRFVSIRLTGSRAIPSAPGARGRRRRLRLRARAPRPIAEQPRRRPPGRSPNLSRSAAVWNGLLSDGSATNCPLPELGKPSCLAATLSTRSRRAGARDELFSSSRPTLKHEFCATTYSNTMSVYCRFAGGRRQARISSKRSCANSRATRKSFGLGPANWRRAKRWRAAPDWKSYAPLQATA